MHNGEPVLDIKGLSKVFDDLEGRDESYPVFENVSFKVPESQFVCLLGSSGCGKTTLLRILAGLTDASAGEVRVDGKEVHGPGQDRSIVFQNYGLLPWRTVMGNVELGLQVRGVRGAQRRAICQKYIDTVGLTGFEKRYPHQISGGMQQRVALARAFSKTPKVLLMDEPFAAVDMQTREKLQDELLAIWNKVRITVVFVTHSVDEAIYLADRVIVMAARPGRIVADIATGLQRPRSQREVKMSARFAELSEQIRTAIGASEEKIGIMTPVSETTKRRRARRSFWRQPNVLRVSSIVATLGIWELYGRQVDPIFFSYPTAIAAAVPELIARGDLQKALSVSLVELFAGLAVAIVVGTLIGLIMGRYRVFDNLVELQINALYSTPNVALVPLLILWFGLGFKAKAVLIFLAACFPLILNTYGGVRNISNSLLDVARAEGASELQIFGMIVLPASVPFIMTGIRLAIGRAVVGMVVAEMFMATDGLGGALITYGNAFATDKVFLVIIILSLLGVGLTEIVRFAENRMAPWKVTERAQ